MMFFSAIANTGSNFFYRAYTAAKTPGSMYVFSFRKTSGLPEKMVGDTKGYEPYDQYPTTVRPGIFSK